MKQRAPRSLTDYSGAVAPTGRQVAAALAAKSKRSERALQRAIMDYLGARGVFCWPMNRERAGRARASHIGVKGISDIIGIVTPSAETRLGQPGSLVAVEVKRPGERPSPHQEGFLEAIRQCGGIAFVAHSVEDVQLGLLADGTIPGGPPS